MSKPSFLRWALVDAWPFLAEVFDESLLWASEVPLPELAPPVPHILPDISHN